MAHRGKTHIFITGKPGIGKTTIIKKVCGLLKEKGILVSGFYTEEVRQGNTRIGFDVVTLDGNRGILARVDNDGQFRRAPKVGKYSVVLNSFEGLVLSILKKPSNNEVLIIDEIGRMELLSESFSREVTNVFTGAGTILATVPVSGSGLIRRLQSLPSAQTFDVQHSNRDKLPEHLVEILCKSLTGA